MSRTQETLTLRRVIVAALSLSLGACASPPRGTPGAGWGADYTPIVDMQGVNDYQLQQDLASCREYAARVDPGRSALVSAAGAAAFGAILAAALGGKKQDSLALARGSALAGGIEGAGAAGMTQQRIIANCLAGRGYRVLDGTAQVVSVQAQAPQPAAPAEGALPQAERLTKPAIPTIQAPPTPPANAVGQESYQVERMAEVKACNATPRPSLTAKGPGFESYTVPCASGDVIMVRCEFGACRVLK